MHKIVVSVMFLGLAGCATPPLVEMDGKVPLQLNRNYAECRDKGTMRCVFDPIKNCGAVACGKPFGTVLNSPTRNSLPIDGLLFL